MPFPCFFSFVPERLQSSFQCVSRTTHFIHIPGTHTCFHRIKTEGFFPSLFLPPPSPNLSLFINCTTWHGSTMANVWAEGLIISYSVWCWFCSQTDQSALQMSGLSVIWVKQREPSQCFCCDLLNTSNSGREYTFYRWLLLLLLLGVF